MAAFRPQSARRRPSVRSAPLLVAPLVLLVASAAPAQESESEPTLSEPQEEGPLVDESFDPIAMLVEGPPWQLTLPGALALALRNNLGLEQARVEAGAARFDALGSWGAFDWVFDATATYTDAEREGNSTLFGGAVVSTTSERVDLDLLRPLTTGGSFNVHFDNDTLETSNIFSNAPELTTSGLELSYVQPLRRGAWSRYVTSTQREAEVEELRRLEERRQARQDLLFDVQVAYWDLVAAIQQREVARSALDLGMQQIDQERRRLEAGDGTEVDVLQARSDVAQRIEELLQAQNDVAQRGDDLKRLLLADEDEERWDSTVAPITALPSEVTLPELPTWQDAFRTALEHRTELRQNRYAVDVARLRHARSVSERMAGLELRVTAGSGAVDESVSSSISDTLGWDLTTWNVALNYNMPIRNRTADYAERSARERIRVSLLAYDASELDVLADVRMAVRDVAYRAEAVRAAEQSLTLAQSQLEAERKRFDAELSTTFKVLEFQQTMIEAMSNERRMRAEYVKSLAGLERAQGLMGESHRGDDSPR